MKYLFAFDMDGTILQTDHRTIHPDNKAAIIKAREQGHIIMMATGRPLVDIVRPLKHNKMLDLFDYLVANNGSYYHDVKQNKTIFDSEVPHHIVKEMAKLSKKFKAFLAIHDSGNVIRVKTSESIDMDSDVYSEMKRFEYISMEEAFSQLKKVTQSSIRTSKENAVTLSKIIKDKFGDIVEVTIANELYVDVIPKGVSKFSGIKKVTDAIGFDLKNVIAFGDSGNDKEMIANVGYGIAMGNATQEAKDVAKEVIDHNDTNAIAQMVNSIIGGKHDWNK